MVIEAATSAHYLIFSFFDGPYRTWRRIYFGGSFTMSIPSIFALCLAGVVSLSAAGQSTAPAQSTQSKNWSAQPAVHKAATTEASAQTASQPEGAGQSSQAPRKPEIFAWPPLWLPDKKPETRRTWPQMSLDKGIYIGRNNPSGDRLCLAIQSYNFSQGESPRLQSVTTCTELRQPLWRNARKPASPNQQGQGVQPSQPNDQK